MRVAGTFTFTWWERVRLLFGRPARFEHVVSVQLDTAKQRVESMECTVDPIRLLPRLRLQS